MKHTLSLGVFADLCLSAAEDAMERHAIGIAGLRAPVRSGRTIPQRRAEVLRVADKVRIEFPALAGPLKDLNRWLDRVQVSSQASELLGHWSNLAEVLVVLEGCQNEPQAPFPAWFDAKAAGAGQMELAPNPAGAASTAAATPGIASHEGAVLFVRRVMEMVRAYRRAGTRRLYEADRLALLRAFQSVEAGVLPPKVMLPIRTDAHRPCPTYLSLADPGIGHLMATCWDAKVLEGTIVHIETIDRGGIDSRSVIEAYRIPSIRDVARIRVLVGEDAPCSVYVGRPVFEGLENPSAARGPAFDHALLKVAHTVAAACSGLFALGVAECKIGMDGLTYTQAVRYMQALTGNTIRDRYRQRFSAAFNIHAKLFDDRDTGREPRAITQPMDVARMAARMTQEGGFEKVTWDGATDKAGSQPLIGQLTAAELLELVHDAHARGLETYISAGMGPEEMLVAAKVGVGGVGIGTRLHETLENGTITHLLMGAVRQTLTARDLGTQSEPGRAAAARAQLDWLMAAGNLPAERQPLRQGLHQGLLAFHRAGNDIERHVAEGKLEPWLTESKAFLDGLRGASADAAQQRRRAGATGLDSHGEAEGAQEDPVLETARAKLAALVAVRDPDAEEVSMMRSLAALIEAGDGEGLRYWLGV